MSGKCTELVACGLANLGAICRLGVLISEAQAVMTEIRYKRTVFAAAQGKFSRNAGGV